MSRKSRDEILRVVIGNIPGQRVLVGMPVWATVDRTDGSETEKTRLIEDLGLDSIDVYSVITDSADDLRIPMDDIEALRSTAETLGDIVTLLEEAQK